jgi:signal transduction histidine kinase
MQNNVLNTAVVSELLERMAQPTAIVDSKMHVKLANRHFYKEFGREVRSMADYINDFCNEPIQDFLKERVQIGRAEKKVSWIPLPLKENSPTEIEILPLDSEPSKNALSCLQANSHLMKREFAYLLPEIFSNLPIAILVLRIEQPGDLKSIRIIGSNSISRHVYGLEPANLIGSPLAGCGALKKSNFLQVVHDVAIEGKSREIRGLEYESPTFPRSTFNTQIFPLPDRCVGVAFENVTEKVRFKKNLKEAQKKLQFAQEEERSRIAREIHDEIGQMLTALKLEVQYHEGPGNSQKLISLIDDSLESVRRAASELRPLIIDDLGLAAAIETYLFDFQKRSKIKCTFKAEPNEVELDSHRTIGVFRIFQEAMTNVARHSQATTFAVVLRKSENKIELEMKDNGKGLSKSDKKASRTFGIVGMRERARLLGGKFEITGTPHTGTRIYVQIPITSRGKK